MSWQCYEPMDLFGEGAGAPVQVLRAQFKDEPEEAVDLEQLVDRLGLVQRDAAIGGQAIRVPRLEAWWLNLTFRQAREVPRG